MRSPSLFAFVLARLALASEPEAVFCAPTVFYCVLDDCLEALSNWTQAAPVFCKEYLENESIDVPLYVPATAGPPDISSACSCVLHAATEFPTPISSSGPPTILSLQTSTVPVPSYPAEIETETPTPTLALIYTTSTIYKVLTYTSEGQIYTDTVVDYTTICPITESSQTPVTPSTYSSSAAALSTTSSALSLSSATPLTSSSYSFSTSSQSSSLAAASSTTSSTLSSSSAALSTSLSISSISSQSSLSAAALSTTSSTLSSTSSTLSSSSIAPSTSSSYSSSTSAQSSSSAAASSTTSSTLSSSSIAPSTSLSYSSSTTSQSSSSAAAASSTMSSTLSSSSAAPSTSSSSSSSTSSTSTTTSSAAASSTTTSSSTTSSTAASSTTSCTLPAETQLVVNPGFEIETEGSYSLPWSLNGMAAVDDGSDGFTPYKGNEYVYLPGVYNNDAALSQNISGFVAASPYTLSFYLAARGNFQSEVGNCIFSVTLAGDIVYSLFINNNIYSTFTAGMYSQQEVTITPTGSTETLEFDYNCGDVEEFPDLALDDITITGPDACPAFCSTDPAAEAFASAGADATLYCNDFLGIPQPSTITIQGTATSTIFITTTVSPTPTPTPTVSFAATDKRYLLPDTITYEFPFTSTYNSAQQSAACSCLSIQPALASTTSTTTIDITSTVVVTAAPTTSSTLSSSSTSTISSTSSCSPPIATYSLLGKSDGPELIQLVVTLDFSMPCGPNGINGYTIASLTGVYHESHSVTFDPSQTLGSPDYCLNPSPESPIVDAQGFDFTAEGTTYRLYLPEDGGDYSLSGEDIETLVLVFLSTTGTCPSSSASTTSLSSPSSSTSSMPNDGDGGDGGFAPSG